MPWRFSLFLSAWIAFGASLSARGDDASIFASFDPPKPIPEILALKPGGMVPPEVYIKYPPKQVGLTIVYKKYVEEEKANGDKVQRPAYDYL